MHIWYLKQLVELKQNYLTNHVLKAIFAFMLSSIKKIMVQNVINLFLT